MNYKKFTYAYSRHGITGFFNVLLGKIGLKNRLTTPIDRVIFKLAEHVEKLSQNMIQSGIYSDTYIEVNKKWSIHDTSSKLLGLYEKEVQDQIYQIQNSSNKKNYFVNIGAGEGFHLIGTLKKKLFNFGIAYEIDNSARELLKKNMKKNDITKFDLLKKAETNFLENKIFINKKLEECLFLIDIEGDEFKILHKENIVRLRNSILIIEIHDFVSSPKELLENLSKIFTLHEFTTGSRDLSEIKILDIFHDYEKWLMAQEGRPKKMMWVVCFPKKVNS